MADQVDEADLQQAPTAFIIDDEAPGAGEALDVLGLDVGVEGDALAPGADAAADAVELGLEARQVGERGQVRPQKEG